MAPILLPTAGSSPVLFSFTLTGAEIWHFESLDLWR